MNRSDSDSDQSVSLLVVPMMNQADLQLPVGLCSPRRRSRCSLGGAAFGCSLGDAHDFGVCELG